MVSLTLKGQTRAVQPFRSKGSFGKLLRGPYIGEYNNALRSIQVPQDKQMASPLNQLLPKLSHHLGRYRATHAFLSEDCCSGSHSQQG